MEKGRKRAREGMNIDDLMEMRKKIKEKKGLKRKMSEAAEE